MPSADESEGVFSWTVTPGTERWLAVLSYGQYAALLGFGLILLGGVLLAAAVALRDGSAGVVLGVLALVLVVGVSRPPILAALRSENATFGYGDGLWRPSRRGLAVAAVVGAVVLAIAVTRSRLALYAAAAALGGASLLAMTLTTAATVDDDLWLETQHTGVDLTTLSGVRSVRVGGVIVVWLSYARGADGFRNPRLLAAPRERAAELRRRLDAGVAAGANTDPISRTERAIVALFGFGVLATGPALWLLVGDAGADATVVLIYPVTFSLVFAGPMLWYAWKG